MLHTQRVISKHNLGMDKDNIINGCDLSGYTTAISGTSTGAGITGNLT
jgi:hypothetical protein